MITQYVVPAQALGHSCEGRNLHGVPVSDSLLITHQGIFLTVAVSDKPFITHQSLFLMVPVSDLKLHAHRIFILTTLVSVRVHFTHRPPFKASR